MQELTTVARFALFALQRTNRPMSFARLALMIDEWGETLQTALDTLVKHNRIGFDDAGANCRYHAVPLAKQPLFPTIPEWFFRFCKEYPPSIPGDTEANTYVSCSIVLLAAVITGSRDTEDIRYLLRLPIDFIALVLRLADTHHVWWSGPTFDLEAALRQDADDFAHISDKLYRVNDDFFHSCSYEEWYLLHTVHDRRLFNGSIENISNEDIWDDETNCDRLAS